jgi:hypothetical protein
MKKGCITSIIFFTFAPMKKNQNQRNYSSTRIENNSSFQRILKRFYGVKGYISFDVFQYLKADHEKLQIVFANIRV